MITKKTPILTRNNDFWLDHHWYKLVHLLSYGCPSLWKYHLPFPVQALVVIRMNVHIGVGQYYDDPLASEIGMTTYSFSGANQPIGSTIILLVLSYGEKFWITPKSLKKIPFCATAQFIDDFTLVMEKRWKSICGMCVYLGSIRCYLFVMSFVISSFLSDPMIISRSGIQSLNPCSSSIVLISSWRKG